MTTTKEVFYVGEIVTESNDDYANIAWPIGKKIRVPEHIKEKGTIGRTAGHGVYITLNLENVKFHTKKTKIVTEEIKVEKL